jgi:hypothetical protein
MAVEPCPLVAVSPEALEGMMVDTSVSTPNYGPHEAELPVDSSGGSIAEMGMKEKTKKTRNKRLSGIAAMVLCAHLTGKGKHETFGKCCSFIH